MNSKEVSVFVRRVIGVGQRLIDEPGVHNAFLGLSLDKSISGRDLESYLTWAQKHCRHCKVIIDDIEFRHNLMVFNGMGEDQAREVALSRGLTKAASIVGTIARLTYLYQRASHIGQDYEDQAIWLKRSSEVFISKFDDRFLEQVNKGYEDDEGFRRDVDAQVERAMGKRLALWKPQVAEGVYQAGRRQLANFVLEETAITLIQARTGYPIEIYPGEPILAVVGLNHNKYPSLGPLNLNGQYGHVSLGIAPV